jgi:hypothetical protein
MAHKAALRQRMAWKADREHRTQRGGRYDRIRPRIDPRPETRLANGGATRRVPRA